MSKNKRPDPPTWVCGRDAARGDFLEGGRPSMPDGSVRRCMGVGGGLGGGCVWLQGLRLLLLLLGEGRAGRAGTLLTRALREGQAAGRSWPYALGVVACRVVALALMPSCGGVSQQP